MRRISVCNGRTKGGNADKTLSTGGVRVRTGPILGVALKRISSHVPHRNRIRTTPISMSHRVESCEDNEYVSS